MLNGCHYVFPALEGTQAGRKYYVAMCPLSVLPRLFLFNEQGVPPAMRAQRTLNASRIPEISRYILDNRTDYVFSAITASVDGEMQFSPVGPDEHSSMGRLTMDMSARIIVNDGQHRRAAIESALKQQPDLADETIAVVFYVDAGLKRSQQLFTDLNKHAVRPTKSLTVLYDGRDPLAELARNLAESVPCFKGLTEMQLSTISNRATALFTLSAIFQATDALLGNTDRQAVSEEERKLATAYWTRLSCVIPQWRSAADRSISAAKLRASYVNVHSVVLHAIGLAGNALVRERPNDWPDVVEQLGLVDWSRANVQQWEGNAMVGGQMSKARQNVRLTADILKGLLGVH